MDQPILASQDALILEDRLGAQVADAVEEGAEVRELLLGLRRLFSTVFAPCHYLPSSLTSPIGTGGVPGLQVPDLEITFPSRTVTQVPRTHAM